MLYKRKRRKAFGTKNYIQYKETARKFIVQKVEQYSGIYGYTFGRVSIRNTKTRWGSCSEKGNLNFSYKLLFLPEPLAEYIVAHEVCHLGELNHSARFWNLVAKTIPDWQEKRKRLRTIRTNRTRAKRIDTR
jgi:predicted metal-dependent hydrolase